MFKFSDFAFGTWRLADKHSSSPQDVLLRIKACLDLGITHFDLADIYGGYTYEKLFGQALALEPSLRERIKLITKCNVQYPCGERMDLPAHYYDTSKDYILYSVDRSLRELGLDYVDVLLIHRFDPLMNVDEVVEAFEILHSNKKVLPFGRANGR